MSTLPILNSDYTYSMTLPVTGKAYCYRPYLVKEEKALLMANETEDQVQMALAMRSTLESCVDGLEVDTLPLADMEFAFAQVRARSAGEQVEVTVDCEHCGASHNATLNLLDASTTETEYGPTHSIEFDNGWVLDLRWPTLSSAINAPKSESEIEQAFNMIGEMLVSLRTPAGMWRFDEETDDGKMKFIESMSSNQMGEIRDYLQAMPQCKIDLSYTCTECSKPNDTSLIGISNFFG